MPTTNEQEPPAAEAIPPLSTENLSSNHTHTHAQSQADDYTRSSKSGKFRFKSSRSSRSDSKPRDYRDRERDREHRHRHHHRHKRSHHDHDHDRKRTDHASSTKRHKYAHRTPSPNPSSTTTNPNPTRGLSPNAAFRESLFDALGDDEGASYWESVYGQPIHNFAVPSVPNGPEGELEQMGEEEYAAYVRTRMWERTREGMIEEQERLRAERMRQKRREERGAREAKERSRFERDMEESLRRGQARRRLKAWKAVWEEYARSWDEVDRAAAAAAAGPAEGKSSDERNRLRNLLYWPVETGKRRDVSREAVEEFMRHALVSSGDTKDQSGAADLLSTLKAERVRWHPDKIQHRYGVLGVDEVVMRSVTEVFQIVDTMWNGLKEKHS
ncbi:uncharacterized protein KD926_004935 [Aspergillus affinis]|uniref:uncharacterized protein n=1 Tax=Aspergillus affinis TaxID=1070780 RepID=UPI0022FE00C4|nr:uncharacterized protein KD926_004935 [Aspergillus affinis]KAI9042869.1 hypothetical protein KD926_004935 [Aspergillus affinis]